MIMKSVSSLFKVLLCALLFTGFSVAVPAQRTTKELKKITKDCKLSNAFKLGRLIYPHEQEYDIHSMRDINSSLLNEAERNLLSHYDDVFVCHKGGSYLHCYIVVDSVKRVGVYNLDGEMMVPPLYGSVHRLANNLVIGDVAFPDDCDWNTALKKAIDNYNGVGIGHFQAVINNVENNKIKVLIPAGDYDDIQYTIKSQKPSFYVAKYSEQDSTLFWGVVDSKAREILPCKYTGIYKNPDLFYMVGDVSGKYVGINTMTMEQANSLVESHIKLAKSRKKHWLKFLMSLGNMYTSTSEVNEDDNYNYESTDILTDGSEYLQQQYDMWKEKSEKYYNNLMRLGAKIDTSKVEEVAPLDDDLRNSTFDQLKRALAEAQSEMKAIRHKAQKQGVELYPSEWESTQVPL